jgi:hypothetical protein
VPVSAATLCCDPSPTGSSSGVSGHPGNVGAASSALALAGVEMATNEVLGAHGRAGGEGGLARLHALPNGWGGGSEAFLLLGLQQQLDAPRCRPPTAPASRAAEARSIRGAKRDRSELHLLRK